MNIVEVETVIREAFNGVVLGKGHSLRDMEEMDAWGERGPDTDLLTFPEAETRDDWSALTTGTLDEYSSLAHVDAEGFRYYIPAFMLSVLRVYDPGEMRFISSLMALYPKRDGSQDYTISRYVLLDDSQRRAIACYLDALPSLVELGWEDTKIIQRAIRNYWHKFLPSEQQQVREKKDDAG